MALPSQCVRERDREREQGGVPGKGFVVYGCVCARERERAREPERERERERA